MSFAAAPRAGGVTWLAVREKHASDILIGFRC
jgi:hypothetical protein